LADARDGADLRGRRAAALRVQRRLYLAAGALRLDLRHGLHGGGRIYAAAWRACAGRHLLRARLPTPEGVDRSARHRRLPASLAGADRGELMVLRNDLVGAVGSFAAKRRHAGDLSPEV